MSEHLTLAFANFWHGIRKYSKMKYLQLSCRPFVVAHEYMSCFWRGGKYWLGYMNLGLIIIYHLCKTAIISSQVQKLAVYTHLRWEYFSLQASDEMIRQEEPTRSQVMRRYKSQGTVYFLQLLGTDSPSPSSHSSSSSPSTSSISSFQKRSNG